MVSYGYGVVAVSWGVVGMVLPLRCGAVRCHSRVIALFGMTFTSLELRSATFSVYLLFLRYIYIRLLYGTASIGGSRSEGGVVAAVAVL